MPVTPDGIVKVPDEVNFCALTNTEEVEVLVIVTPPVDDDTDIPDPADTEVTPALLSVTDPPNDVEPPPDKPDPAVTVMLEFCNPALLVCPEVFKLFAKFAKLRACVILHLSL